MPIGSFALIAIKAQLFLLFCNNQSSQKWTIDEMPCLKNIHPIPFPQFAIG